MRRHPLAFLPLLALAACQDGSGPGDSLTLEEALAVTAQVIASGEGAALSSLDGSASSEVAAAYAGVPTTFIHTLQSTHPCPSGGQLRLDLVVHGSFDEAARDLELDLEGSQTHSSCAFPHNGIVITIDGNPDIDFTARVAATNGQPSEPYTATVNGGFRWSASDGRDGVCTVTINAVTDFAAKRRTVEGDICGHTVTATTTWS
jgi:hypothetical protein